MTGLSQNSGALWVEPARVLPRAVGHVALRQPDLPDPRAVDVDPELRIARGLLQPDIDRAAHLPDLAHQLHGQSLVGHAIGAGDLDVQRRRRAEIQNLADDVGGQEGKDHAREPARKLLAQGADIVRRGLAAFALEAEIDVAVRRADHARVAVGMLMELLGTPMLSTTAVRVLAG
ncbi:MAG: hypothetical protein WDN45_08715 [Caulobacteraceae bacterium]